MAADARLHLFAHGEAPTYCCVLCVRRHVVLVAPWGSPDTVEIAHDRIMFSLLIEEASDHDFERICREQRTRDFTRFAQSWSDRRASRRPRRRAAA